uniref:DNA-directed RNA polymerase I subunit RPA49 n=1 Tax=Globisporangium ultimum (strain ATCC 200006 / CBS 805.95 / DAOM BR144) TaxID=431595 RepID=K3WFG6_GLOUD
MSSKRVEVSLQYEPAFDSAAPLVATFRNGPPPPAKRSNLSFEVFENPAKKQRLVVASTEKIAYQGANFGYLSAANDCASYAVGIYDKTTKEVRLCNVNQIYVMQQSVKGASENVDENKGESKSFMEQRRDLVEVFGSKKSKRMQKSREENIVNIQNISGAVSVADTLQKKIDKAQKKLDEERARDGKYSVENAALVSTRNAILPPIDVDAATPDRVYNLRKFLDTHVMESLQFKATELIEALQTTSVGDYTSTNNIGALATRLLLSLPTPYDTTKVAYIVYISYLLQFYNQHFPVRKSATMLSEEKDIPLVVVRHLLKLFTESAQSDNGYMTYLQPKTLKDKLILYMIVVAISVNNFSLDLTEIMADLKKSAATLTTYCRQLGCTVDKAKAENAVYGASSLASKNKQVFRAVLALPLQFPQPKRAVGPRR